MSVNYGLQRNGKCCAIYELPSYVVTKVSTMDTYQDSPTRQGHSEEQATCSYVDNMEDEVYLIWNKYCKLFW